MPLARTSIPDPPPSEDAQAPPGARHTNLRADAPVWAAARRSYVEDGCSSCVVAERHGLNERTVRRHARNEDWPGLRAAAATRRTDGAASLSAAAAAAPHLDGLADVRTDEIARLLFQATPDALAAFALRRACEFAATGHVGEAKTWMRLSDMAARTLPPRRDGVCEADLLRAEFLAGYRAAGEHAALAGEVLVDAAAEGEMSDRPDCPPAPDAGRG